LTLIQIKTKKKMSQEKLHCFICGGGHEGKTCPKANIIPEQMAPEIMQKWDRSRDGDIVSGSILQSDCRVWDYVEGKEKMLLKDLVPSGIPVVLNFGSRS